MAEQAPLHFVTLAAVTFFDHLWATSFFAETINASKGIGYLVSQASSFNQVPVLVVCIILYALLGICADLLVRSLERSLMPWRSHLTVR